MMDCRISELRVDSRRGGVVDRDRPERGWISGGRARGMGTSGL